jgi:hypothetical protein
MEKTGMIKLRGNWLLWQVVIIYAAYIIVGVFVVPRPYMSSGTAIASMIAGSLLAMRYGGLAAQILLQGKRGDHGAHDAVMGAAELAIGLIYSGIFRLAYVYFGEPESWRSTVWGALGLLAVAKGCFRMFISPDEVVPGHRFPEGMKMALLWSVGLVIAFIAGANFGSFWQ